VLNHWQDWNGEAFELLAPAAERLGRAKRYRYAVEQLQSCGQLAAAINDWQTIERHEHFVAAADAGAAT
jgi:hypothetical protein